MSEPVFRLPKQGHVFGGIAAAGFGALLFALFTQHWLGMRPCPWCILQRLLLVAVAFSALPGALFQARAARVFSALMVAVFSLAGATAAGWQHFVAARSPGCNFTLADRIISGLRLDEFLPEVFAPMASCAEAAATLLGVPYEFLSLSLFLLFAVLAILCLANRQRQA